MVALTFVQAQTPDRIVTIAILAVCLLCVLALVDRALRIRLGIAGCLALILGVVLSASDAVTWDPWCEVYWWLGWPYCWWW